jgi:hypothetical protein
MVTGRWKKAVATVFRRVLVCGLVLSVTCAPVVLAEMRRFTSIDGEMTEGKLVAVDGAEVTLQLPDGKKVPVPLERFSETDQEFIRNWHEENKGKVPDHLKDKRPRVDVQFNSGRSIIRSNNQSSHFMPSVVIESRDAIYPIHDATLNILMTAKSMRTGKSVVVYKHVFEGIHLPVSKEFRFQCRPFQLWYDENGSGFKFKGYSVWLEDPEGKVLAELHAPPTAANYVESIQTLDPGDTFDREYKKTGVESLGNGVKQ